MQYAPGTTSGVRKLFENRPASRPAVDVQFAPGDNVKRLNDGAPGVIHAKGLMRTYWVTWTQNGTTTVIEGDLVERA